MTGTDRNLFGVAFETLHEEGDRDITEKVGKTATRIGVTQATGDPITGAVASEVIEEDTAHTVGSIAMAGGIVVVACVGSVLAPFALLGYGAKTAVESVIKD